MIMTGYTWTKPIASCGAISAVLSSVTSSSGSNSLTYDNTNLRYQVETADCSSVQTHSFYLTLSGTDLAASAGVLRTEILGPYVLKVVCPNNVGVSETSPILSEYDQVAGGTGAYTLTLTSI